MLLTTVRQRHADNALYAVAASLVLLGLAHLAVQLVDGRPWTGPVSWRKPVTFGLSFGITLATVTWVSTFVPLSAHRRTVLLRIFGGACVAEGGAPAARWSASSWWIWSTTTSTGSSVPATGSGSRSTWPGAWAAPATSSRYDGCSS